MTDQTNGAGATARPTIRTVQIRARDLQPGDIFLSSGGREPLWLEIADVTPASSNRDRVAVYVVDDPNRHSPKLRRPLDLVTIQKEVGP